MEKRNPQWIDRVKTESYFLPLACFAGSETCFFSFRFSSFSRCSFLCCSRPSAFFAFFDKILNLKGSNKSVGPQKPYPSTEPIKQPNSLIQSNLAVSWETKTPTVEKRCPKCGSQDVKKGNNQEYRCSACGKTFYFVTPQCGSQLDNVERYEL
jgi:hypothetical protein